MQRHFKYAIFHSALALCGIALFPNLALAQAYPNKPIKLVVPFPPGGLADLIARPLAEKLSVSLGQPVVIDNRGGASGTIGTAAVVAAKPDGYTLLFTTANEVAVSPILYSNLYDPVKSFTPVASVVDFAMVLVTGANEPGSLPDLVARAKNAPGKVTFAMSGVGTTNHLLAEMFRQSEAIAITHVAYKGGGPAMVDVAAGHVDAMFATLPSALGLIGGGKFHALAVTSAKRSPVLPNVPTIAQAGGKDLVVTTWAGVLGPAGLPPAIVALLDRKIAEIVATPEFRATLARVGAEPLYASAPQLAEFIVRDNRRWAKIIADAKIALN